MKKVIAMGVFTVTLVAIGGLVALFAGERIVAAYVRLL